MAKYRGYSLLKHKVKGFADVIYIEHLNDFLEKHPEYEMCSGIADEHHAMRLILKSITRDCREDDGRMWTAVATFINDEDKNNRYIHYTKLKKD
jgi:hypothetical protein